MSISVEHRLAWAYGCCLCPGPLSVGLCCMGEIEGRDGRVRGGLVLLGQSFLLIFKGVIVQHTLHSAPVCNQAVKISIQISDLRGHPGLHARASHLPGISRSNANSLLAACRYLLSMSSVISPNDTDQTWALSTMRTTFICAPGPNPSYVSSSMHMTACGGSNAHRQALSRVVQEAES